MVVFNQDTNEHGVLVSVQNTNDIILEGKKKKKIRSTTTNLISIYQLAKANEILPFDWLNLNSKKATPISEFQKDRLQPLELRLLIRFAHHSRCDLLKELALMRMQVECEIKHGRVHPQTNEFHLKIKLCRAE